MTNSNLPGNSSAAEEHENWDFRPRSLRHMPWHSEAEAPAGVPILDLALMLDAGKPSERRKQLGALREAVTHSGFLYLKNHGIADEEIEAIANETRAFYGQPESYKSQFDHRNDVRGYTGYRNESTARLFGTSRGKDLCMKYTMGPELTPAEVQERITCEADVASKAYSANVFPNAIFRAAWIRYYQSVQRASGQLLRLLGDALELSAEYMSIWNEMLVEKSCGELRFFQYPDVPRAACADVPGNGTDRMAAHFDVDVITLLHQTPCENGFVSLEAKLGEQFFKVPAIRGTLVVNLGEIIRLLTGGKVKATVHRVVRPPLNQHKGSARDVTVFFQAPPLNAKLRPVLLSGEVGQATVFDDFYRHAGAKEFVAFADLRASLFGEFIRQTNAPDAEHELDSHLFNSPAPVVA